MFLCLGYKIFLLVMLAFVVVCRTVMGMRVRFGVVVLLVVGFVFGVFGGVGSVSGQVLAGSDGGVSVGVGSRVVSCVPGRRYTHGRKGVLLTFDDGPSAQTSRLLDVLGHHGVSAVFFVVGVQVSEFPGVVRRMVREGHFVGNHSVSHRYVPSVIASELPVLSARIKRLTGVGVLYFRSPGLTRGSVISDAVRDAGVCELATDYDVGDWRSPRLSSSVVCSRVVSSAHRGSIVLLHDGPDHVATVDAVPCILRGLKRRGLRVVSADVSVGVPRPLVSGGGSGFAEVVEVEDVFGVFGGSGLSGGGLGG